MNPAAIQPGRLRNVFFFVPIPRSTGHSQTQLYASRAPASGHRNFKACPFPSANPDCTGLGAKRSIQMLLRNYRTEFRAESACDPEAIVVQPWGILFDRGPWGVPPTRGPVDGTLHTSVPGLPAAGFAPGQAWAPTFAMTAALPTGLAQQRRTDGPKPKAPSGIDQSDISPGRRGGSRQASVNDSDERFVFAFLLVCSLPFWSFVFVTFVKGLEGSLLRLVSRDATPVPHPQCNLPSRRYWHSNVQFVDSSRMKNSIPTPPCARLGCHWCSLCEPHISCRSSAPPSMSKDHIPNETFKH